MTVAALGYGALLVAIEVGRSVPAWLRVRRHRTADGISPTSTGILAGTGLGWIWVAALVGSPAAAIANTVWLAFHSLLCVEVCRADRHSRRPFTVSALVSGVAVLCVAACGYVLGHPAAFLGVAIAVATACYSIPALIRGMTSTTTAGLSMVTLALNTIEAAVYLIAGVGLGGITDRGVMTVGYIVFGSIAMASNGPRLIRTARRRIAGSDARSTAATSSLPRG